MRRLPLLVAFALGSLPGPAWADCPLPGTMPMTIVTFYFGEDIPNRAPLTSREWRDFAARAVTPAFPDGFTVSDGEGQWLDPKTTHAVRERSKILTVAVSDTTGLAAKIEGVRQAYDRRFHQQSVGVTTVAGCGAF